MAESSPVSGAPEEEIIELTDIIEEAPAKAAKPAAEDGMDVSFESELDDLFAEDTAAAPASKREEAAAMTEPLDASAVPDEDIDLSLPEDAPLTAREDAAQDIDVAGLDALLEEKPAPAAAADPVIPDMEASDLEIDQELTAPEPEPMPAPEPSLATPAADPLEGLDSLITGQDVDRDLDAALAADGPQDAELIDLDALMNDTILDPPYSPPAQTRSEEAELLADLGTRMAAMEGRFESITAGQLEALAELGEAIKSREPAALSLTSDDLAAAIAPALSSLESRLNALEERIDGLKEEILAKIEDLAVSSLESRLTSLNERIDGLKEDVLTKIEALAGGKEILAEELRAEIDKAVPAAAAKVIREEIEALVRDLD